MDSFLLYTDEHCLEAVSIPELAELCACAIDAGDPIAGARVCDPRERRLNSLETVRLLAEISRQRGTGRG